MNRKINYYDKSKMFQAPDASKLPHPDIVFGKKYYHIIYHNMKYNMIYNKKATEEIKKLLNIK